MDPIAIGRALSDLGGWTVAVILVVAILVGLWRRWWVPGFWFSELESEVRELRKTVTRLSVARARDGRRRADDE